MSAVSAAGQQIQDDFESFLRKYYREEVYGFAERFPGKSTFGVEWYDIFRADPTIADLVLDEPDKVKPYLEEALANFDIPIDIDLTGATVAIEGLPDDAVYDVGDYRSEDVNSLIGIRGVVSKQSQVEPAPEELAFECQRCGTPTYIPQRGSGLQEPHECEGCERKGPFVIDYDLSTFRDHRLIRMQLPPNKSQGTTDSTIDITLYDDLVTEIQPGDHAIVGATLRAERRKEDKPFKLYAEAESVHILETDFEDVEVAEDDIKEIEQLAADDPYQTLIDSFAPSIYGNEHVKEAIVLQLFGGMTKELPGGGRERGHSHVALIGDPGTGKSKMLEYATEIAPRSVFSGGKTSSAAGLTASAVRDDFGPGGEWTLEGGALVKADNGLACIDELDKADEDDRNSLHEALEQMQISVSKAGINATLNARTTLLAAANPISGRFNEHAGIAEQIDLDPALLSRFDLLFTFQDHPDAELDGKIINHKAEMWDIGTKKLANDYGDFEDSDVLPALDKSLIRKWIAHAKRNCHPTVAADAKQLVKDEFTKLRQANNGDGPQDQPVPVTFRRQEAIHRLAEASARIRLSDVVETQDVRRAIRLIRRSLEDVGLDPETGQLDADVIETGMSNTQRNRRKKIRTIANELADGYPEVDGTPKEEVIKFLAEEFGFTRSKLEHDIEKMLERGELYSPGKDHIAYYE